MISLLGYLCQSILSKASKTKLIIMTHDSSFALNMSKMINAIDSNKLSCWELQKDSSDSLIKLNFGDIDRYAGILRSMYDFALQEEESLAAPPPMMFGVYGKHSCLLSWGKPPLQTWIH